jgi:hypothetical protein
LEEELLSQLLNVSDIGQIEIHKVEPLVPGNSHLEAAIAIAKFKKYRLPGSDSSLGELVQTGGEALVSVIHKLIKSIWNKGYFPE